MKLKVVAKTFEAIIRIGSDNKREIILGSEVEESLTLERIPENTNVGPKVKELSQINEAKRKIKLKVFKDGETFKIVQRYLVKDDDDEETTTT